MMLRLCDAREYKKQIKRLYKSAFPKEERAPLFRLFHQAGNGTDSFYAALEDDRFVGLVYAVQVGKLVYLFYLAVEKEKRGSGYGSKILRLVKELYPDCIIVLSIEDTEKEKAENYEQRIRRLRFYEANGFRRLHIKINEAGVDYELLGTEDSLTQADFLTAMKKYFGPRMFRRIYRETKIETDPIKTAADRIRRMERCFDALQDPAAEPENNGFEDALRILTQYYESGLWLKDYELDERGLLPKELKRGVLSQDALYDLLSDIRCGKK